MSGILNHPGIDIVIKMILMGLPGVAQGKWRKKCFFRTISAVAWRVPLSVPWSGTLVPGMAMADFIF
ncbi:MAG: hypothetical protein BWK76_02435 [Desulfobulbaceae bacterium A2]|nr:MAG: hypothetical protein BWK76_02435 [Desulfobulbaceae bacterium A2]